MVSFKVETKNKVDINKKPRVYFTCHPDDFEKYFRKVCDDIFKTHDCAIYYTEDMTEIMAEDEKEIDLGRNNLFIAPVTYRLLSTPNRAMDEDIPYALKKHIPVLPIMMESGIDEFYSKPNKFGELQYLNPYSSDLTEIPYKEKLKKYLESILISDEMTRRVRAAFDAYIFLSYRKKDRKYANELMRLIHSIPECRDTAVWFDEFLTPGESFKENIEKTLDSCKLFTLLITPQLLEKVIDKNGTEQDNYVISTELPLARKKAKEGHISILAVEMAKTNKDSLRTLKIEDYVNINEDHFRYSVYKAVTAFVTFPNDSPEHDFLIGLAYLEGIDMEIDRERGIELISSAALAGLPEAMFKLYKIYSEGIGVDLDYKKATIWINKYYDYMVFHFGEEHSQTLFAINAVANLYNKSGCYEKALAFSEKAYKLRCKLYGEDHTNTFLSLATLASSYCGLGNYKKGLELNEKAYILCCKNLGEEHPYTLTVLSNLSCNYGKTGDYKTSLELEKKVYILRCKLFGEKHPDTLMSLNNLACSYGYMEDYKKACELEEKAYTLRCQVLGQSHPDTQMSLSNLAEFHRLLGDYNKAIELGKQAYLKRRQALGEEHPDTLISLNNLAFHYGNLGYHNKQEEILKEVYELRCVVLGKEHPETLATLNDLYTVHNTIDKNKNEIETLEKNTLHEINVLGMENPKCAVLLTALAFNYNEFDFCKHVVTIVETAYNLNRQMLGEKNNITLELLSKLARFYELDYNFESAIPLYEKLCSQQVAIYGANHPKVLKSLGHLEEVRLKLQNNNFPL